MTTARDAPGVIAPPPLIYFAALAIGFGLQALLPSVSLSGTPWTIAGIVLAATGGALATAFVIALRTAGTPVDPYRPTTAIVTTGPYRLTRNPGYLALALAYVGIALLSGALWPLVSLVPALLLIDRGVIAREERYLQAKFGDEYRRYKARTRRWI
jgi:protein-S-isoprenylcysteine O-methyltransferase Ste14